VCLTLTYYTIYGGTVVLAYTSEAVVLTGELPLQVRVATTVCELRKFHDRTGRIDRSLV